MKAILGISLLVDQNLLDRLAAYVPALAVAAITAVLLAIGQRVLMRGPSANGAEARLPRQLIMLFLTVLGLFLVLLALPLETDTRGQVLSFAGVLFTAVIALSSATFVSNAMAGMMVRMIKCFRPGDFVRVKEEFGRITERGLFHVELQTESGDLTTVPNLYLITNPVTVVRSKGTVISTKVSLGYDESWDRMESLLKGAAEKAGLTDAFVHVLELQNFAILYKVAGFSSDVQSMLTTRSNLCKEMLDALHHANVEIMSPTFMTQRQIKQDDAIIPTRSRRSVQKVPTEHTPEAVIFEKANRAAGLEALKDQHDKVREELAEIGVNKAKGEERDKQSERRQVLESAADGLLQEIDEVAKSIVEEDRRTEP